MSIVLNVGDRQARTGTFSDVESLNQSTATSRQSISVQSMVTQLATTGSTGTGFGLNLFTVASYATAGAGPVEGFEKYVVMTGTGEAKVVFNGIATDYTGIFEVATNATGGGAVSVMTAASATGAFVLTKPSQYIWAKMINQQWRIMGGQATYATAT
jgi:hypothetical protein